MESLQISRPARVAAAAADRMISESGAGIEIAPPAVLLCGGAGQRMGDLAAAVPKPMLTVGGTPLLMHIMHTLATHVSDEFVLVIGHLAKLGHDFFRQFQAYAGDFTIRLGRRPSVAVHGEFP